MAAKLLHSIKDENPDFHKQLGCMTGIFQLFDRQQILMGGKRIVDNSSKRIATGKPHLSVVDLESPTDISELSSAALERYSLRNMQQKISTESSRASFSSSSRSSSFSSHDCSKAAQLEPASLDRMICPENSSREPVRSFQDSSPLFVQQTPDIRDFVKDSMYRDFHLSAKAKTNGSFHGPVLDKKRSTPADVKQSLRVLAKLRDGARQHDEPIELFRSSSYHSKDASSFSISRDAARFFYDGRDINVEPFDKQDGSRSSLQLIDLPRLSLDSREVSARSLTESKSNMLKSIQKDSDVSEKAHSQQQRPGNEARPPSVVAKLMGLEALPDSVSSIYTNFSSSRSHPEEDVLSASSAYDKTGTKKSIPLSSSSSLGSSKEPSSPNWRSTDSLIKPALMFPIESAPWKQMEVMRGYQKLAPKSTRGPAKPLGAFPSVYSEIEKRSQNLELTQSGKDLRALKQILGAMQAKGLLETLKEEQSSNFSSYKDPEQNGLNSTRAFGKQSPRTEKVTSSTKRKTVSSKNYECPIVIMKTAKLVEKYGVPSASVISLEGTTGLHKHRAGESAKSKKGLTRDRRSSEYGNAVNAASVKSGRTSKHTQNSARSQRLMNDGNAGLGKSSGSISPRMQEKNIEMEKRSRPQTPPDSSRSRRQANKQQSESNSPGVRRKPKHPNSQKSDDQQSETSVESRNLSFNDNEDSAQSTETIIWRISKIAQLSTSEISPSLSSIHSPSSKSSEIMFSGLPDKESALPWNEEESSEFGFVPPEYYSPVSVLDNGQCKQDSPSPVKYVGKTLKVDASSDQEKNRGTGQLRSDSVESSVPNYMESGAMFDFNRQKLRNIENLVQKLRRLNSSHDEARTDYIASLCENSNPDQRYISEILLASGLLLRDLTDFQFHPSGNPLNPELFLVLEQTKASTLREQQCRTKNPTQLTTSEKVHRKLIFDSVNEILARKLTSVGPLSETCMRACNVTTQALTAQMLLRQLCSEIETLQAKIPNCSSTDNEDKGWKNIVSMDVMCRPSERWMDFNGEIPGAVLDIERMIFKDLVNEIVIGDSGAGGLVTKSGGFTGLFVNRGCFSRSILLPEKD